MRVLSIWEVIRHLVGQLEKIVEDLAEEIVGWVGTLLIIVGRDLVLLSYWIGFQVSHQSRRKPLLLRRHLNSNTAGKLKLSKQKESEHWKTLWSSLIQTLLMLDPLLEEEERTTSPSTTSRTPSTSVAQLSKFSSVSTRRPRRVMPTG